MRSCVKQKVHSRLHTNMCDMPSTLLLLASIGQVSMNFTVVQLPQRLGAFVRPTQESLGIWSGRGAISPFKARGIANITRRMTGQSTIPSQHAAGVVGVRLDVRAMLGILQVAS